MSGITRVSTSHVTAEAVNTALDRAKVMNDHFAVVSMPTDFVLWRNGQQYSVPAGGHLGLQRGDQIREPKEAGWVTSRNVQIAAGIAGASAISIIIGIMAICLADRRAMLYGSYGGGFGGGLGYGI